MQMHRLVYAFDACMQQLMSGFLATRPMGGICVVNSEISVYDPYFNAKWCVSVFKETKSATMNIFLFFLFRFKSFVKVELSYVFTINLFTIAENCTEK